MGAPRTQYKIVGRYINSNDKREVVGYHLSVLDGSKNGMYTTEQVAFLVGRDQVCNCKARLYKEDVIFEGDGINLESLPVKYISIDKKKDTNVKQVDSKVNDRVQQEYYREHKISGSNENIVNDSIENTKHILNTCQKVEVKIESDEKCFKMSDYITNFSLEKYGFEVVIDNSKDGAVSIHRIMHGTCNDVDLDLIQRVDIKDGKYQAIVLSLDNCEVRRRIYNINLSEDKDDIKIDLRKALNDITYKIENVYCSNAVLYIEKLIESIELKSNNIDKIEDTIGSLIGISKELYFNGKACEYGCGILKIEMVTNIENYHKIDSMTVVIEYRLYGRLSKHEIYKKEFECNNIDMSTHEIDRISEELCFIINTCADRYADYDIVTDNPHMLELEGYGESKLLQVLGADRKQLIALHDQTIKSIKNRYKKEAYYYNFTQSTKPSDVLHKNGKLRLINIDFLENNMYYVSIAKWGFPENTVSWEERELMIISKQTKFLIDNVFREQVTNTKFRVDKTKYKRANYHDVIIVMQAFRYISEFTNLKINYLNLNKRVFENKLDPKYLVLATHYNDKDWKDFHYAAFYSEEQNVVVVNGNVAALQERILQYKDTAVLIHEMCHEYADMYLGGGTEEDRNNWGDVVYGIKAKNKYVEEQLQYHGKKFGAAVEYAAQMSGYKFGDIFGYGLESGELHTLTREEKLKAYNICIREIRDEYVRFGTRKDGMMVKNWYNRIIDKLMEAIKHYAQLKDQNCEYEVFRMTENTENYMAPIFVCVTSGDFKEYYRLRFNYDEQHNMQIRTYRDFMQEVKPFKTCFISLIGNSLQKGCLPNSKGYLLTEDIISVDNNMNHKIHAVLRRFCRKMHADLMNI